MQASKSYAQPRANGRGSVFCRVMHPRPTSPVDRLVVLLLEPHHAFGTTPRHDGDRVSLACEGRTSPMKKARAAQKPERPKSQSGPCVCAPPDLGNRATVKCKRTCRKTLFGSRAQPSNPFFQNHLTTRGKILGGGRAGGRKRRGPEGALLLCDVACDTQAHSERSVR
jgi:hypothetical protein